MAAISLKLFILAIVLQSFARCHDNMNGSLVLVIDDTGSMIDDIEEIKGNIRQALNNPKFNPASTENYVLVTFNDPDVSEHIVTKDRNTFIQAIDNLKMARAGGDCPEYSLSGIERALEASLPRSNLYVFTDASAKDHYKYENIKNLAQQKSAKINFVLTGSCSPDGNTPDVVYNQLAAKTSGVIHQLEKSDIHKIFE